MNVKLAAYMDEVYDDPDKSGDFLASKGITSVCLRRAWCRNIFSMPDNAIDILNNILIKRKLKPVMLYTDIGCVEPEKLVDERAKIIRAMQVCKFLNCKAMRVGVGLLPANHATTVYPKHSEQIHKWLTDISSISISYDLSLLIEPDSSCYYNQPASLAILFNKFRRLSLLYDPALLVMRSKVDTFIKFWSLLKSKVSFIDIHDFKSGNSAKPAGHGDAQLDILVADAINSKFSGWFCLEPGLGSHYGNITTKEKTFLCAFDAFESLLQRIQLPKIL